MSTANGLATHAIKAYISDFQIALPVPAHERVDACIEWDAANMQVTNLPDANKFVRTAYRQGWSLGV